MSIKQGFDEVAKKLGLQEMNTERVIDLVKHDILISMYRKTDSLKTELTKDDKDINSRVEKIYEQWYGAKFKDDNHKVLSMFLVGPPGQGKTTTFKVAGAEVATAMGLNFVMNPPDSYKPNKKDFLFVSVECSGENSSVTFGGIPSKVVEQGPDGNDLEYMKKLPNKRLALLGHVAGGLLLLDDFSNTGPNVQNVALSVTDEKRFQGLDLRGTYIGMTGNLGALDGTHTTQLSTALRGRCITFFTRDEMPKFVNRALYKYNDDIGDAGIIGFLQRNPECFAELPSTKESGGYPSPRTWDHFIEQTRSLIRRNGGRAINAIEDIKTYASIILGNETGLKFSAYYLSLVQGADPLARGAILDGKLDKERLKEKYGGGTSEQQQSFGYQFAMACSDYTVELIKGDNEKNFKKAIERFALATLILNPSEFTYAINYMKAKLAAQVDKFSTNLGDKSTRKVLSSEVKQRIGQIVVECEDCTGDHRRDLIDALSDADKLEMAKRSSRRVSRT